MVNKNMKKLTRFLKKHYPAIKAGVMTLSKDQDLIRILLFTEEQKTNKKNNEQAMEEALDYASK